MLERLCYHVEQEMRLLSSIIKGARIRDEAVIELKRHQYTMTDNTHPKENEDFSVADKEDALEDYDIDQILANAKRQAEEIIQNATEKARDMIQEALNTIQGKEEESQKYVDQLIENANIEKTAILEEAKSRADMIIKEAEQKKNQCIVEAEQDMVNIIIDIVGHVISKELADNSQWVSLLVRKMIDTENISEEIDVFVPKDIYTKLATEDIQKLSNDKVKVTIREDDSLNDTKIVVATKQGNIEYDVKMGLEKVFHDIRVLQSL